jgi:hypothetical protein
MNMKSATQILFSSAMLLIVALGACAIAPRGKAVCKTEVLTRDEQVPEIHKLGPVTMKALPDGSGTELSFGDGSKGDAEKVQKHAGDKVVRWTGEFTIGFGG